MHLFSAERFDDAHGRIAHALGGIRKQHHANCAEGMARALKAGYLLFEVDLAVTADGAVVCYHELDAPPISLPAPWPAVTREQFLASRYRGNLTPVDLEYVLEQLHDHSDICLITDTKHANAEILPKLNRLLRRFGAATRRRIVPQTYNLRDLKDVIALKQYPSIAFTRYLADYADVTLRRIARVPEVHMIAMYPHKLNAPLAHAIARANCGVFVHTINDERRIRSFHRREIGVFTDFCPPR